MAVVLSVIGQYNGKDLDKARKQLAELEKASGTFKSKFSAVGQQMEKVGAKVTKVGGTLTKSLTLPIVGLGAAAVKGFADFDAAITQSTAIMGNVSEEMRDRMTKAAREVATSLNISHNQAAESFYFLASAGMDAEQSIAALPQVAAFAKAGMFDMATATDLATDAQSALGLTSDDASINLNNLTRVTDVFVKANTLANASVEQFSKAITTKAGVALRNANKSVEEGAAVLSVFADQGIKSEAAGTMLARTLEGLQDNSRKNAKAFNEFGIAVYDSNGQMRPMVDIVSDMETAFAGMSDEERNAAIAKLGFNKLAKQGILALLGNSDALAEYQSGLEGAGGTVDEVAQKQLQTFNEQLGLLGKQLQDIAIDFGPIIIDQFLTPLVNKIKALADRFKELTPQQRQMVVTLAGIAAAAGPALMIIGKLISSVGSIIKVFAGFTIAGSLLAIKIIAVVAVIAGIVLAFKAMYDRSEALRDGISQLIRTVQNIAKTLIGDLFGAFKSVTNVAGDAGSIFDKVATILGDVLAGYIQILIRWWNILANGIRAAIKVFEVVFTIIRMVATLIRGAFIAAINILLNNLGPVSTALRGLADGVRSAFTQAVSIVRNAISNAGKFLSSFINGAIGIVNKMIDAYNALEGIIPGVTRVANIAEFTFNDMTASVERAAYSANNLANDIGGYASQVMRGNQATEAGINSFGNLSEAADDLGLDLDSLTEDLTKAGGGASKAKESADAYATTLEKMKDRLAEWRKGLKEDLDKAREEFFAFSRDVSRAIMGSVDVGGAFEGAADRTQAIADAEKALADARAEASKADAGEGAAAKVLAAEDALAQAKMSGEKLGLTFMEALNSQAEQAKEYAAKVQQLLTMDLDPNSPLMQLIMGSSHATGIGIMDELITGGVDTIQQAEELLGSVQQEADDIGLLAAGHFKGAGVDSAQATINGFDEMFGPGGKGRKQLMRIMDKLAARMARKAVIDIEITKNVNEVVTRVVQEIRAPFAGVEGAGARGAIVRRPTIALIGEAGPEALLPLDRTRGNSPVGDLAGGGVVINVNAGMGTDGAEVGRQIVDALRAYSRRNGPLPLAVS